MINIKIKFLLIATVLICVLGFIDNALADNWRWAAGVRQCYSNWQYENSEEEKISDDSVFMGPDIKIRNEHIFCEINILIGLRDINLDDDSSREPDKKLHWDADAIFGYALHPRFAVTSGFKRMDMDYSALYFGSIGTIINIPIQSLSFLCSAEYLPIGKVNGLDRIDAENGWSAKIGTAYTAMEHVFYGGYQYQKFYLKDKISDHDRDSNLSGIVLSYNYHF